MLCKVDEVNFLGGPGRGVILIKLQKEDDRLLGFIASTGDRDLLTVETTRGAEQTISTSEVRASPAAAARAASSSSAANSSAWSRCRRCPRRYRAISLRASIPRRRLH